MNKEFIIDRIKHLNNVIEFNIKHKRFDKVKDFKLEKKYLENRLKEL